MHQRGSELSRTTRRTTETTVAAESRDAKEGRLWLQRRPVVASYGSRLTLLCGMAKARCSVPAAAPESSHMLFNNDDRGTCTLRSRTEPRRAASRLIATTGGAQHPQSCGPADIEFDVYC